MRNEEEEEVAEENGKERQKERNFPRRPREKFLSSITTFSLHGPMEDFYS